MIPSQVLQNTIEGIRDISHLEIAVTDADGHEVASTAQVFGEAQAVTADFISSQADSQSAGEFRFFKVFDEHQLEYILILKGGLEETLLVGRLAALQISGLLVAFKERYDRDSFMKNLLLDNLLLVDIYGRAKKLRIPLDAQRVVMIIETVPDKERNALEAMQEYVGASTTDFVTAVDENNVVIVRTFGQNDKVTDIPRSAQAMEAYLMEEGFSGICIAYGTVVGEIKEVSRSYKEAKMALDVSKIFFEDHTIIAYNELGIGRLIYQLPIPLCKMFIREIFKGRNPDEFDEETITTINKFFENSLNVSETSRQLFIHRNTLVYRLDKLQKSTGLDLRVFEDAITFKIALMVVKYMKYMEQYDY